MPLVVDASFSGAWLLPDEASSESERVLEAVLAGEFAMAVPDLWSYEIANLLLVARRRGRIDEKQVDQALRLAERIPCTFYDHRSLLARQRVAGLASRFGLSAYDAAYLELADRLRCPLRSLDNMLLEAAESVGLDFS